MFFFLVACQSEVVSVPVPVPAPVVQRPPMQGPVRPPKGVAPVGAPDILFIVMDTVRADSLALYGGRVRMPNLERLASKGVVFDQAFSHFPMTPEEHWVMLSGVLPEAHLSLHRGQPWRGETLPEILYGSGWNTGAFVSGLTMTHAIVHLQQDFEYYDENWNFQAQDCRPASQTVAAAVAWRARQVGPTLTFVHLFDAHAPYTPSVRSFGTGVDDGGMSHLAEIRQHPTDAAIGAMRDLYESEIAGMDAALGTLLKDIKKDTIVVVTADHGESFSGPVLFEHSTVLLDSVLHVPLVVSAPQLGAGRREGLVGHVDVLPTLLSLVGVGDSQHRDGRVILPETPPLDRVYARAYAAPHALRPFAVRTADWKVIRDGLGQWQAFDLRVDPQERSPLAAPDELRGAWEDYLEAVKDTPAPHMPPGPDEVLSPELEQALKSLGYLGP